MRFISRGEIVLRRHATDSHKGDNGRLLIIGGSAEYVGAPALAGLCALAVGVDIVRIAAPERVSWALNAFSPDLITVKLPGERLGRRHLAAIQKLAGLHSALLIGNGLGTDPDTARLVREILKIRIPMVIDADALKVIRIQDVSHAVLTPHAGEYDILLKNSGLDEDSIQENLQDNVIVRKGPVDQIIARDRIYYNKTGNAGMTKGGTGDCLAGVCAGLVAKGYSLRDAGCFSAYINGYVGDEVFKNKGFGLLASDMAGAMAGCLTKFYR